MAEQTFRSPGFFEQEIDLSARVTTPSGTPGGVIGTADRGPAFVPVTVGSFADFETRFGSLDPDRFGPYAVREFLNHKTSLTYMRLLGAGANESATDISNTEVQGTVTNAGFRIKGTVESRRDGPHKGAVQLIVASHTVPIYEQIGYPIFTDNNSFPTAVRDGVADTVRLVRGVIFTATGTKLELLHATASYSPANTTQDFCATAAIPQSSLTTAKYFKIAISSSVGATFSKDDNSAGIRMLSASLDPNDANYISKVLNTDPLKFQSENHLLYLDLAVEETLASTVETTVAILSGTQNTSQASGDTTLSFLDGFGRFDTRYTTPRTTAFISQPFGNREYDLFHFETLSDGANANDKYKISIANLRASTDDKDKFGSFEVQLRAFSDTDTNQEILERYPECSLNPDSDRYVARQVGDKKVRFNFDQEDPDERRLVISGKYPNVSRRIRIVMNSAVEERNVPRESLPFGFHGLPVLKTSDTLTDGVTTALQGTDGITYGSALSRRLGGRITGSMPSGAPTPESNISGSIVPPMPLRFKVTRGKVEESMSPSWVGFPGNNERVDSRYYWGIKPERLPLTSSLPGGSAVLSLLDANVSNDPNPLISAYSKFAGIQKLDMLVTGSGRDEFNNNKFTLARVALGNNSTSSPPVITDAVTYVTATARDHMLEACYLRNGVLNNKTYTISDGIKTHRFTLASLLSTSSVMFNRFSDFAKFTNIFYGGFDGINILDEDQSFFKDRAFSTATGGKAQKNVSDIGLAKINAANQAGGNRLNNNVASARSAIDIMTDAMTVNTNILTIPGVSEPLVTDHALMKVKAYSQAIFLLDLVKYDEDQNRLYDDSSKRPDVRETAEQFELRALDNSYGATFFPDVFINDPINNRVVKVPSSVAALGTLAFNDKVAFPWFAPAGFNRGGLDFVENVDVRLSSDDRDILYDARINPIAVFPRAGFVIFGQKSLQMAKSALDRINVRRLMLEIKRQIVRVANRLLFEPNNAQTRARFVAQVTPLLSLVQTQAGIEQFKVVCDATNNSALDVEANKMNGKIIVVPTRAVEFISIDFIITNSGVSFE